MLVLSVNLQAQDLKIMVNKSGKVGFSDAQGKEVVKCQYTSAQPYADGVAIVSKGEKTGMIDATGKVLLPLKYSQITKWHNDLYIVQKGSIMGLANAQGQVVLPVIYTFISKPNCYGKAFITTGGIATTKGRRSYIDKANYGIVNTKGKILVTPQYKGLFEFTQNVSNSAPFGDGTLLKFSYHFLTDTLETDCQYLGVKANDGTTTNGAGIIDATGQQVMPENTYDIVMKPVNDMVRFYIMEAGGTMCGYYRLDQAQKLVATSLSQPFSELKTLSHSDFYGNMAVVYKGAKWDIIDREGKVLRTYSDVKMCKHLGLWAGKDSMGKWEVFDYENNDVKNLSGYDDISFPYLSTDNELFSVKKNGKYGCVDRNNKIVIPFTYGYIDGVSSNMLIAQKLGKWGVISTSKAQLIPFAYKGVMRPQEADVQHLWVMGTDSLYYHYNLNKKKQMGKGYKVVTNFSDNIAYVMPKDFKPTNTPLYRAQMFPPNTPKEKMDSLDISTVKDSFGYLIDVEDRLLCDTPISLLYKDKVMRRIQRKKLDPVTKTAVKQILLDVTQENRTYDIFYVIDESEWNF